MAHVEFQDIPTGRVFGGSEHSDRAAAAAFAIGRLIELGESHDDALDAVGLASSTFADTRTQGYAVRIY